MKREDRRKALLEQAQAKSGEAHSDPHHAIAKHDKCDVSGSIHVRGEIETHIPPDLARRRDTAEEKKEAREHRREVIEVLTVIFVILYAGLTAWMARSTAGQLDQARAATKSALEAATTAQNEFVVSERPWVAVTYDPAEPIQITKHGAYTMVWVSATNVGHSVAEAVWFQNFIIPMNAEDGHECDLPPQTDETRAHENEGAVIFPGSVLKMTYPAFMPQKWKVNDFTADSPFDLVGCVTYHSVLEPKRHTTMKTLFLVHEKDVKVANPSPGTVYRSYTFGLQGHGSSAD